MANYCADTRRSYSTHRQLIQQKKMLRLQLKNQLVVPSTLTFGLDMRTRFEMRHGYRGIPLEDTSSAYVFSQRYAF
jgi:hypothetical protein